MKKKLLFLTLMAVFGFATSWAQTGKVKYTATDGTESYMDALPQQWITNAGTYQLQEDLTQNDYSLVYGVTVTLDLNGHNLTINNAVGVGAYSGTLTITGSGAITTNHSGAVESTNTVYVNGGNVTIDRYVVVNGTVAIWGSGNTVDISGTVNGGKYFAVSTNGSKTNGTNNTTINVKTYAKLTSDDEAAMYLPGYDGIVANITGGTITGKTGIEIRAGELNVTGGTITATADALTANANNSGQTVYGAAIAVSQHTTNLPVKVNISGGTMQGIRGLYEKDLHSPENLDVAISITGGTFTSTDGSKAIEIVDVDENNSGASVSIKGGTFNPIPSETYLSNDDIAIKYTSTAGAVSYYAELPTSFSGSGTYQLLKDVTRASRMTTGVLAANVTLDLNGHTLTSTASDYAILLTRVGSASAHKTFDIVNTDENNVGTLKVNTAASTAIQAQGNYNDVTIGKNVVIDGNCVAMLGNNQTLNVEGTINGGNDFAVATNGDKTKNATINIKNGAVLTSNVTAMYLPGTGTTTVEDNATITGATGIYIKSGTLNITGGTINGTGAKNDYTYNGNGANSTGNALVVDNCGYPGGAPVVNITGGEFNSTNNEAVGSYGYNGNEPISKFISGGSFSSKVPEEYCADGYQPTELLPNGKYGVKVAEDLALNEAEDNSTTLETNNGKTINVTLTRTLHGGYYNTIALPFNVDHTTLTAAIPGAAVAELISSTYDGSSLELNFNPSTAINAGKAYLIYVPSDVTNPTFNGVTINNTASVTTETNFADFVPVINPVTKDADMNVMFLGAENKLYYVSEQSTINGFRGYFNLKNVDTSSLSSTINMGGTPTGIKTINNEQLTINNGAAWYTIDGRQLNAQPTQKGIYIHNGKKVVVK